MTSIVVLLVKVVPGTLLSSNSAVDDGVQYQVPGTVPVRTAPPDNGSSHQVSRETPAINPLLRHLTRCAMKGSMPFLVLTVILLCCCMAIFLFYEVKIEFRMKMRGSGGAATSSSINGRSTSKRQIYADPRPKGLRLLFIGDSISRYHYISFTHFLRHGEWLDPASDPNPVNEKSYEDWQTFYESTSGENEYCDCHRVGSSFETAVENRYFYEPTRDNYVVYIQCLMDMHGREDPSLITIDRILHSNYSFHWDPKHQGWAWQYTDWADAITQHVAKLDLKPDYVLFNAGIWPNDMFNPATQKRLATALKEAGIQGIWRTTSFPAQSSGQTNSVKQIREERVSNGLREHKCQVLNVSWTKYLGQNNFWDRFHMFEPVYRVWGEDLLGIVGYKFPSSYERFDRTTLYDTNEEEKDTALTSSRDRPQGLRLVFLGDPTTRMQYLSLATYLTVGLWFDPSERPNFVNEYDHQSTNAFFTWTNYMLQPFEMCDCHRGADLVEGSVENRYFYEPTYDNMLVFFQHMGHSNDYFKGRRDVLDIKKESKYMVTGDTAEWQWQRKSWQQMFSETILKLTPKPTHVIVNGGILLDDFHHLDSNEWHNTFNNSGITTIWRTSIYPKSKKIAENILETDRKMQRFSTDVLDVSWTEKLTRGDYWSNYFPNDPVYRIMNEELVGMLGLNTSVLGEEPASDTYKRMKQLVEASRQKGDRKLHR